MHPTYTIGKGGIRDPCRGGQIQKIWRDGIFDPQKCPTDVQQLHKYGTAELEKLLKFYGETTEIEYEGNVFSTPADVDKTETRHEWKAFKLVIFEEKSLSLKELATLFLRSEAKCVTFPNIKILLTIAMVLPVSTATVERSFSDIIQIKDRLRNRLLPASMFKLMFIAIDLHSMKWTLMQCWLCGRQ